MQSNILLSRYITLLAKKYATCWFLVKAIVIKNRERLLSLPAEAVFRAMNFPSKTGEPLAILETPFLAGAASKDAKLNALDLSVVDALRHEGSCSTTIDALGVPLSNELLSDALCLSNRLLRQSRQPGQTERTILSSRADDVSEFPSLFAWGLENQLLDIVEAYLGTQCGYGGVALTRSKADGKEMSTRIWHRDREDRRMVKIIVYLGDVAQEDGPFEILQPQAQMVLDSMLPWPYATVKDVKLHKVVGDYGAMPVTRSFTGQKGTIIFVDTARCHHRGRPPKRLDRSALFYTYFPQNPRHPFFCDQTKISPQKLRELSEKMPPRQQACIHWRDSIPFLARLVPNSRMTI